MKQLAIVLVVLTAACAGTTRPRVQPGTDMALPESQRDFGFAEWVVRYYACGGESVKLEPQHEQGDPCRERADSLGPVTRAPGRPAALKRPATRPKVSRPGAPPVGIRR